MIRISPATYYRAAATCVAAAVFSFSTQRAAAQQSVDLFGGTNNTPTTLTIGGTNPNVTSGTSTPFGPGFSGMLTFGVSAVATVSEGFNSLGANTNSLTISRSGLASLAGTTSATKTYSVSLTPGASYSLSLALGSGSTATFLGSLTLSLSEGSTQLLAASSGQGLAGAVDVLGLFGSNGTASVPFTVPTNATGPLFLNISSSEPANVGTGTFVFQSASVNQVPEPGSVAASLLGAAGLVVLRFRRRLRAL